MSHIISGLLWNTCIAGGLAIVIFLAQQAKYLRIRPQVCHALWLLVLVKLISPTFFAIPVSIGLPRSEQVRDERLAVTTFAKGNPTTGNAESISVAGGEETLPAQTVDVMLPPQFAISVSAFGSLALLLTSLSRVRRIGRLVKHAEPASQWIQDRVAVASRQLRLKCVPSVCMVRATISPFLWGALRGPRIVLPSGLISTMEPESVELIIQHELTHYARRDHWTNFFVTTLTLVFWWNPIVWWARRELRIQQELCCDRMVLAQDHDRRVRYAETLLATVDFVASSGATCPSPATAFGSCSTLKRRVEMIVSPSSIPFTSNWAFVLLFALIVLPLGVTNAEEEESKDWSAERREVVERIEEFTREIEELRSEGKNDWAKHLVGQRDYFKGILPMLDKIVKLEQSLKTAQAGQDFDQAEQFQHQFEALADKIGRAGRIGEMKGRLSELKVEKHEFAEKGEDKARQRVEAFVADQEKLLKLVQDLHAIVETDDDKRIETLAKQVDQREESLLLRIEEFHLERHMIEARQEGEDVRELEAELEEVRQAVRELSSGSK